MESRNLGKEDQPASSTTIAVSYIFGKGCMLALQSVSAKKRLSVNLWPSSNDLLFDVQPDFRNQILDLEWGTHWMLKNEVWLGEGGF